MSEPRISKEVKKKQIRKHSIYREVFKSPMGKKVLHDMFLAHSMMSTTYVPNDPVATAIREGERSVILRILTILETSPIELERRIEEANSEEEY